jgi:hypothetical protein
MDTTLGEFGAAAVGPGGYVSYASIGATLGIVGGPIGLVAGAVIGGVVDLFVGARQKKKMRDKMKKAFYAALLKRYNQQIFLEVLERMGSSAIYLSGLGLKPGTPEFDQAMQKKMPGEYKGSCAINIFGPAAPGQKRPAIATISSAGKLTPYSPHIDVKLGEKWSQACREFYKAALKSWATEQAEAITFKRELQKEKSESQRRSMTRVAVNAGIIMILFGYSIRQKRKLKFIREQKAKGLLPDKPLKRRKRRKKIVQKKDKE